MDKDRDGKLALDELRVLTGDDASPEELHKWIDPFDREGDQQLGPPELLEALKSLRP